MWSETVGLCTRSVWDQIIGLGLAHYGLVLCCETSTTTTSSSITGSTGSSSGSSGSGSSSSSSGSHGGSGGGGAILGVF